jgi:hypothetical protein
MRDALPTSLLPTRVWWMQILSCVLLAGCAELLPKSKEEVASPWHSYQEAQTALQRVVPYQTTKAELRAAGVDPFTQPNIALLTYSDVILRFPLGGAVPQEKLACLPCVETLAVRDIKRDRTANFWLDSLKFYRRVDVSGWSFNAIILLVDDTVVYTLYGGQPMIREQEDSKQPLGPLQNWGDVLPGLVH